MANGVCLKCVKPCKALLQPLRLCSAALPLLTIGSEQAARKWRILSFSFPIFHFPGGSRPKNRERDAAV